MSHCFWLLLFLQVFQLKKAFCLVTRHSLSAPGSGWLTPDVTQGYCCHEEEPGWGVSTLDPPCTLFWGQWRAVKEFREEESSCCWRWSFTASNCHCPHQSFVPLSLVLYTWQMGTITSTFFFFLGGEVGLSIKKCLL